MPSQVTFSGFPASLYTLFPVNKRDQYSRVLAMAESMHKLSFNVCISMKIVMEIDFFFKLVKSCVM